jgi:hypothetical protein
MSLGASNQKGLNSYQKNIWFSMRIWWRLLQKRVMCTKFDTYGFIVMVTTWAKDYQMTHLSLDGNGHDESKGHIYMIKYFYMKSIGTETCQKYSVTVIFYYIFHIKPQFLKTLFQSQFLFDFDEVFTNRSENVRSFLWLF